MSSVQRSTRREVFLKLAVLLNGVAGLALAVPMLRYLLSPIIRGRRAGSRAWVSLGSVDQFPAGETRFATYINPVVTPSDGSTAGVACWVRNVGGQRFQIFAINCAHLGCPVRWFPQSSLFMCPCHGGAYYADGSRASGPPERGLFEYRYRVKDGTLFIESGDMPTPGALARLTVRTVPWA
jgi:menaquinol-cytochrome c reductase iron-sulfur subunit